jgi:hypothetical protein
MRISDADRNELGAVYIALSETEAAELRDALTGLSSASAGWHAHVTSAAGQTEITVYRDDDVTAVF